MGFVVELDAVVFEVWYACSSYSMVLLRLDCPESGSAFENGSNALAASYAHRLQSIAAFTSVQFVQQARHDARANCAYWMTQ